jgi:Asp-tRNA(Asn)/Glu-tRNA(Gln) amidotransferase A subunit family amidase
MPEQSSLLGACLRRIAEREPEVRAWVEVNPQPPLGDGPLRGLPFGVKDVFETSGMATEYGSALYRGRQGASDAALVTELRRRGAVLLGKTQTAAFAHFDPPPTRNPAAPGRTPGGSSSGSAAAVAAGMAWFAVGTQTLGSVIRPASFCGVAGFKPSYGALPREGMLPLAPTLDTPGYFTKTAADMAVLWPGGEAADRGAAFCPPVEPEMEGAFRDAIARLRAAGFAIRQIPVPDGFERLLDAVRLIARYEGARTHERRWRKHGAAIGRELARMVEEGLAAPEDAYREALEYVAAMRRGMAAVFSEYPVIFTPAAPGPAPVGLASTGDPRLNAPWTGLGGPAISIPMPVRGVPPMGLQMTAAPGRDGALVETARVAEAAVTEVTR